MNKDQPAPLAQLHELLPKQYLKPDTIPQVYQSYRRSRITSYIAKDLIQAAAAFMTLVSRQTQAKKTLSETDATWLQHELNCFHTQLKKNQYPDTINIAAIALLKDWATCQLAPPADQTSIKPLFNATMTSIISHCLQQKKQPFDELVQLSYLCMKTYQHPHDVQTNDFMKTIEHHLMAEHIDRLDTLLKSSQADHKTSPPQPLFIHTYLYAIIPLVILIGILCIMFQKQSMHQFIHTSLTKIEHV